MYDLEVKYLIMLLSMSIAVMGQILLKKGVNNTNLSPSVNSIFSVIFSPSILIGLSCYAVSAVLWLFVLKKFPLSVAYPSLSLTYIVVLFLSVILFDETLTPIKFLGVFFILVGVFFINR